MKGAASDFWVFGWGEVDWTEFKHGKQVGKNIYSLFVFFLVDKNAKFVRKHEQRMIITCKANWTKHYKAMIKAWTNIITLWSMDTTLLL